MHAGEQGGLRAPARGHDWHLRPPVPYRAELTLRIVAVPGGHLLCLLPLQAFSQDVWTQLMKVSQAPGQVRPGRHAAQQRA